MVSLKLARSPIETRRPTLAVLVGDGVSRALDRAAEEEEDDDNQDQTRPTRPPVPFISTRPPVGAGGTRLTPPPGNSVVSPSLVGGRLAP